MRDYISDFIYEETGAMTLEAAIITATLVALALVFRKQLASLWNEIYDKNEKYIRKLEMAEFRMFGLSLRNIFI